MGVSMYNHLKLCDYKNLNISNDSELKFFERPAEKRVFRCERPSHALQMTLKPSAAHDTPEWVSRCVSDYSEATGDYVSP